MFTLAIEKHRENRQVLKTSVICLAAAAFCILLDNIYAIFGHGVTSHAMTLMFLYPLLGGVLPFYFLYLFVPGASQVYHYRASYNIYNSGIALLTTGSLLQGVFEIAGTSSPYTAGFYLAGAAMASWGVIGYLRGIRRRRRECGKRNGWQTI